MGASGFRQRAPTDRAFSVLIAVYLPQQKLQPAIATQARLPVHSLRIPERKFDFAHARHPNIASFSQDRAISITVSRPR
jgi:hypothetical protein